jgi:hypothetical protein
MEEVVRPFPLSQLRDRGRPNSARFVEDPKRGTQHYQTKGKTFPFEFVVAFTLPISKKYC